MRREWTCGPTATRGLGLLIAFLCILSFSSRASAKVVQLQLVPYDQLTKNVADLEKSRPLANPVSTPQGMVMKQVGVETVAWARNVLLDGKPVFERYVDGKYIGRSPVVDVDLEPGDHKIWPGDHQFTVAGDGAITSASPEFLIAGNVVKLRCYPLTVRAFRANPDEGDLPMSMRVAALPNLTIRDATDAEARGEHAMDLLPVFEKFSPLTLWLPANTVGKGYVIHPVGLTLHLTADGVKPAAGGGELIADLRVEKNLVDIPLYGYPIEGVNESGNRLVVPGVEQFLWQRGHGSRQLTNWYPRSAPYVLQLSEVGPTISVAGDLRQLPFKRMAIDYSDRVISAQRLVVVEAEARHLTAGSKLRARIRAVDTHAVSAAESAYKPALNELRKLMNDVAAAAKKKAEAQAALTSTKDQIAAKTKQLEDPKVRPDRKKPIETELAALTAKAAELNATIAAASAETEPYDKKIEALKPIVADLKAKMQTFADANSLAGAPVFAQIQSYDGGSWKDLFITPRSESREFDIAIPVVADGMYRLKVGVIGDDPAHRPLAAESWVSITTPQPFSIGLFTNRGRDSFYRGEGFWIGLGMLTVKEKIPAGAAISLDLVDSSGKRMALFGQQTAAPVDQRRTIIIRIEPDACLSIAAGHYRVEAKVGQATARPLVLDIVDPEPRTHFTNLLNLKYNTLDKDYDRIIETGEGAEEFAQWIANLRYNAVVGLYYGLDRVVRHDAEIEQMVRERPELGPWESYYQPSGRDKIMSALLRRNIRFYEDIFTYNDTGLPRDPRFLDASARFISLETASMRLSPIFKGVCLYDEFYNTGDNGNVTTVQINYAAQEVAYRAQYAKEGYTSARAFKGLDRFTGRPFGQRDYADLAMFRTWQAHEDKDWAVFSLRMSGASKRVMPDAFNFTQQRFWGSNGDNLAPNGLSADVFQGLDAATCVSYKDGGTGERPVFPPMQADVLRVRDGLPVWTQLHDSQAGGEYGMHLFREAFFGLSQKVEGFIYFYIIHDPHEPAPTDHYQFLKNLIGGVTEPYGDFLMSLDKGYSQVGIYYSRQSEYLSARKPNSIPKACEGLWVACMRAGFPARFITDDQLLEHAGDKYKVIFFPGVVYEDETDPKVLKELQRLVDAGKTIIVEKSSKLPIERIVHADSEFDEYDDKLGGAFPRYEDHETDTVLDGSEETTKLLRQLLPKYAEPATESTMLFSPDWLKKGDGQYMVMANFAPTKFTGLYKTLYQAPDNPDIRFPKRPAAVYDVLEMKPVEVKTQGDWMTLSADLRHYPGKIYAFLPAAIDKVSLQCTPKVSGGRNIDYSIAVADSAGQPINASFPVEIALTSPSGETVFHINRAAAPKFTGVYRMAVNAAAGTWKLKVRELISGAVSEANIGVEAGAPIGGSEDARPVWVRDAAKVKAFLADPTPAQIVVDQEQAWVLPQAQRLAAALTSAGKPTTVVTFEQAVHMPPDYDKMNPIFDGSRLWRGDLVQPGLFDDAPVILLGKRLESRLIEGIVRRDAVVESISADFPGPGRAIVAWAPLAFSTKFDSLLVMGQDEAALAKGVDELLAANLPTAEIPIRQVTAAVPDPGASLAAGKPAASAPKSLRKWIGLVDAVTSIDTDSATGRVLIGTFGYGDNLFCFDAQGKLLWKKFLPEQNVYLARWYDGGKRVLAATGRGPWIFILDAKDGAVSRKFLASEWPDGHGYSGFFEGQGDTQLQITINPALSQIIIGGRTGILAVDFGGRKMWFRDRAEAISSYPATAEQNLAACFGQSLQVGNFAISPDGRKIASGESVIIGSTPGVKPGTVEDLWAYRPMILDAKTGDVLAHNEDDPGSKRGWSIAWPARSPDPIVHFEAVSLALHPDGKLSKPMILPQGLPLPGTRFLHLAVSSAAVIDSTGKTAWSNSDEKIFPEALQSLSADRTRLFRCDIEGLLRCTDVADGKTLWEYELPFDGYPCALADGGVVVGTTNGLVIHLDKSGKPIWNAALIDLQQRPGRDYAAYIRSAVHRDPDNTGDFFPINHDQAGDYDKVFRMGVEQLKNGSFESVDGWTSADGEVKTAAPGKDSAKSLSLPTGQLVTQRLKHRIIPLGTYLLEFWFKVPDEGSKLVAGAMLAGEHDSQILTASKFYGRPNEWTFGRLAVKALGDTRTIDIGFQSDGGGIVYVDNASFRPVRFPSANLLANVELQAIEPTFVRDLRVQYDRIPADVRERLMSKNHVAAYRQGPGNTAVLPAQEQAFLHNGRIDDVGPFWFEPPDGVGFSAVLTKAAWISHVVLYLNNATPENTYRFISILANNIETKVPQQVALVRGNDRRFVIVKFDKPIFTDSIKILPGFHGGHKECLTEVELYGPLGGPDVSAAGFPPDDQGYPMFMGNAAHVPTTLPADLSGEYALERQDRSVAAYNCGPTVCDNLFTWGNATGDVSSLAVDVGDPGTAKRRSRGGAGASPIWPLLTVSPTSTPARYGSRLLVGSADYQLHAVSDQGVYLWGFKTGGRVYSSPLPDGDDVYFGSDDGLLYKVDLHSGMLLWDFETAGRIRSSPAMANGKVYVASWDGFLYAIDSETGQLIWKSPLALYTRSSPAIAGDRIFIGDESGKMLCFNAKNGALVWKQKLGGYISCCPLVTEDGALFVSEQGDAAMVGTDGEIKWKRSLGARVKGQPSPTKTQALVPTSDGLMILKRSDGTVDSDVQGIKAGQVLGALVYHDKLCLIRASVVTDFNIPPRTYVAYPSMIEVWAKPKSKP